MSVTDITRRAGGLPSHDAVGSLQALQGARVRARYKRLRNLLTQYGRQLPGDRKTLVWKPSEMRDNMKGVLEGFIQAIQHIDWDGCSHAPPLRNPVNSGDGRRDQDNIGLQELVRVVREQDHGPEIRKRKPANGLTVAEAADAMNGLRTRHQHKPKRTPRGKDWHITVTLFRPRQDLRPTENDGRSSVLDKLPEIHEIVGATKNHRPMQGGLQIVRDWCIACAHGAPRAIGSAGNDERCCTRRGRP